LETSAATGKTGNDRMQTAQRVLIHWDDVSVLKELGKQEAEREAESKRMTLDALRLQNRSIEAYLMRLVRQRDTLKHITRLAEECDSYFVLGLDGPDVTEDEVKKAYRALARKEHPDKAGTENKGRFQEIQQAYAAVLRQRKLSGTAESWFGFGAQKCADSTPTPSDSSCIGPIAQEAVGHAETARDAADRATSCAYQCFQLGSLGAQARGLPKRGALRELKDLAAQATAQLRSAAVFLRSVRDSSCAVAKCAKTSLEKYGEFADLAIAGAGLRERASLVHEAGLANLSVAEHLEKTSEISEMSLQQAARCSSDRVGTSDRVSTAASTSDLGFLPVGGLGLNPVVVRSSSLGAVPHVQQDGQAPWFEDPGYSYPQGSKLSPSKGRSPLRRRKLPVAWASSHEDAMHIISRRKAYGATNVVNVPKARLQRCQKAAPRAVGQTSAVEIDAVFRAYQHYSESRAQDKTEFRPHQFHKADSTNRTFDFFTSTKALSLFNHYDIGHA
jgi:hypothetical protein